MFVLKAVSPYHLSAHTDRFSTQMSIPKTDAYLMPQACQISMMPHISINMPQSCCKLDCPLLCNIFAIKKIYASSKIFFLFRMDSIYITASYDNFRQEAREPFRNEWNVADKEKASFKLAMEVNYPTNYSNHIGLVLPRSEMNNTLPKLLKDASKVTEATAALLSETDKPVLVLIKEGDTPLNNLMPHVIQVKMELGKLRNEVLLVSIEEESIDRASALQSSTPVRNTTQADQPIVTQGTPHQTSTPQQPNPTQHLLPRPVPTEHTNLSLDLDKPQTEFKQQEYTSFAYNPPIKTEPNRVFLTQPTPGRLTITLPSFNPATDSVEEVLAKLQKLIPLYGNDETQRLATPTIIYNFLQASNLDHLILNLSSEQLNNFESFRKAMLERYARVSPATDFYHATQNIGELEADLIARLTRMWQRIKSSATIQEGDKLIIRERFLGALRDPTVRLKLRESNVSFEELPLRAQQIRAAREIEDHQNSTLQAQINILQEELQILRVGRCPHCGLGHEGNECRANPKMKAQHNKNVRRGHFPPQRNFDIGQRGGDRGRGRGRWPPRRGGRGRDNSSRARGNGYINQRRTPDEPRNYLVETDFF